MKQSILYQGANLNPNPSPNPNLRGWSTHTHTTRGRFCPQLTELSLSWCGKLTIESIKSIRTLKGIQRLDMAMLTLTLTLTLIERNSETRYGNDWPLTRHRRGQALGLGLACLVIDMSREREQQRSLDQNPEAKPNRNPKHEHKSIWRSLRKPSLD